MTLDRLDGETVVEHLTRLEAALTYAVYDDGPLAESTDALRRCFYRTIDTYRRSGELSERTCINGNEINEYKPG